MIELNCNSRWSVLITNDQSLNFAIYIGSYYGFLTNDMCSGRVPLWPTGHNVDDQNVSNFSALKKQWYSWWTELVEIRARRISRGESYPLSDLFNPPEFPTMHLNELAEYLRRSWPLFQEWWNMPAGGSMAMGHWESLVNVQKHVSNSESMLGRKLKEFNLTIDLIYTGMTDIFEINPQHVIMTPVILMDKNWWNKKIEELG